MSNLTITVNELLPQESKMESSTMHPSSLTCVSSYSPVQLNSTEDLQTWLQQAFPANHSALPENEPEPTTNETCGQPQSNAFAWYDRDTHCWRTSQASLLVDILEPFSETWPRQGMTQDGEFYPQPKWEPRISEIVSGLLPTMRASLTGAITPERMNDKFNNLESVLARQMWPTPTAGDGTGGPGNSGRQGGLNLRTAVTMLPTPTVIDAGTGRVNKSASKGAAERPTLAMMAKQASWPTPTTRDWRSGTGAQKREGHAQPLTDVIGGQLNPTWVEWLMEFPLGWTDLKPLEMHRWRQWQRQHGICSPPEFIVNGDRPLPDWCIE